VNKHFAVPGDVFDDHLVKVLAGQAAGDRAVFGQGPAATRAYALDLLRSDPGGALILGMTTAGSTMTVDEASARTTYEGMMAVMEAIDAHSTKGT